MGRPCAHEGLGRKQGGIGGSDATGKVVGWDNTYASSSAPGIGPCTPGGTHSALPYTCVHSCAQQASRITCTSMVQS